MTYFQFTFDQIEQLVRLLLTIPSSSAEAERSFSSLRRLKSYLRSRMKQNRLNHLSVLYVHKDKLDTLGVDEVVKAFIAKCQWRSHGGHGGHVPPTPIRPGHGIRRDPRRKFFGVGGVGGGVLPDGPVTPVTQCRTTTVA